MAATNIHIKAAGYREEVIAVLHGRPGFMELGTGDERSSATVDLTYEQAHALADWIIANVPKPEPIPLPTKFAAVVKSHGNLYSVGDTENEPKWVEANTEGGNWVQSELLRAQGFEVVFEGVDE